MDMELINATNPILINLIGAGGTGSKVLTGLAEMDHCMKALGHPGLQVRLWDDDVVAESNLGRQRFAVSQVGLPKSVVLINNINRWTGSAWKAETRKFDNGLGNISGGIFISCVDNVEARFQIADVLKGMVRNNKTRNQPRYWMDFGNSRFTGQVILSTVGEIEQPQSDLYLTTENLPFVTEEFGELLRKSEETDNTPSCSLSEALQQQDLYINSTLAQMGCSLLWNLFRNGFTENRGFFLNLKEFSAKALKV
ncbi:PRTRC system ThiF family protein [Pedobacter xixiisoli]|uniref:PRTRC system ThiF family protein n=2 Tax=Pedobacter xixiisoli TaxID=1476464 RepID=A0A286A7A7_9SPHI|nr:PRTRC system ThiF family protein [Pedobacter xixiisoli]